MIALTFGKRTILFVISLLFLFNVHGKTRAEKVDSLLFESRSKDYTLAEKIQIAEDIIVLAGNNSTLLIEAYSHIASLYLRHSLYKEAIVNFEKSIAIAKPLNKKNELAFNYYFLGNTYMYLEDLDQATDLYGKSKAIFKETGDYKALGMVHNSQGIVFSKKQQFHQSYQAFFKSYRIFDSLKMDYEKSYPMTNIGDYYLKIEEPDSAIKYFMEAIEIENRFKELKGKAISLGNIGLAYLQKSQYKTAINHFKQSLEIAEKNEFNKVIYDNYKDLSETYKEMNDFKKSLLYYEKYSALKDSIVGAETKKEIVTMQSNYESARKEKRLLIQKNEINKLEYSEKISRFKIYLIVSCFFLLLITSVFVVFRLRSNLNKRKLKEALIKSQLDFQESESKRLETELENKNQDLTNFALDIARKNEFTQSIDRKLKIIKQTTSPKSKETMLQALIFKTNNHLKINEDFEHFQNNIEKVNHEFFQKLAQDHKELTANEIHLCGLIRLGLTIKDIASIKNISPKSVEMNRYRLRKKLNLNEGVDLNQFLITL